MVFGRAPGQAVFQELIPHHDEAAGIGVCERSQNDGVDDAEDRGICTDAEREREHRGDGEAGGAGEAS